MGENKIGMAQQLLCSLRKRDAREVEAFDVVIRAYSSVLAASKMSRQQLEQEQAKVPDSAALEGWRNVQHLQFQAFAAAGASIPPVTFEDWHRRNAWVSCFALVCKDWWQAVAPAEGLVIDSRLQRQIRIIPTVTAADMRPWWTIVTATSLNIDDAVIIALADRCPALTDVSVAGCWNLTDAAIIRLAEGCPSLISIDVSNCSGHRGMRYCNKLTDAAVIALAERCPALTAVDVSWCKNLTDAAFIGLAEHCPALTSIYMNGCKNLTDAVIIALAERCPGLTDVNVMNCSNLTDAAIIALAEGCPALTQINVTNCRNLTDAAIIGLADRCPALTQIDVMNCNKLTDVVLSVPFVFN